MPDYLDKCADTPPNVEVNGTGCPLDDDKDGVPNYLDKCPKTPLNVDVNESGCPLDDDKDGVPNYLDKCPNTSQDVKVDSSGCEIIVNYMFNFEFNSYRIDRKYYPEIEKLADLMKKDTTLKIEIQGYTDNIGEAKYNMELSNKRAEAVKKLLVNKFHIDANRIKSIGYGMSNPIADNSTPEGQAKNRRVVVLNITHREETKGSDMLEGETINSETNSSETIDEDKEDLPVNFVK